MFDPHGWSEDSYYEALGMFCLKLDLTFQLIWVKLTTFVNHLCVVLSKAKAQKAEMDKLEKAKKEKTKVKTLRHSTYYLFYFFLLNYIKKFVCSVWAKTSLMVTMFFFILPMCL